MAPLSVCITLQWTYRLDGQLVSCGGMENQLDRRDYGLHRAALTEIEGLIFVWLAGDPDPLHEAEGERRQALAPQGLNRAKVAHTIDYEVRANWKLLWENNRECWHCAVGHPQYVKANFDASANSVRSRELASNRAADHRRLLSAAGVPTIAEHAGPGLYAFPAAGRWWSANRTPTSPGFVTESIDGQPVAPLMGDYPDWDVGTLRVRSVPNFWCHASADHAVLTRLLPAGPELTRVRVQWLVHGDAVEGSDYRLDRLFALLAADQRTGLGPVRAEPPRSA
jgi:Rieske 2Fe-2S family protein